jgi:type IV pilus assembly protein PilO
MAKINFQKYVNDFRNLNPRDVGTWPILPRLASAFAIIAIVLVLGWLFYWSDLLTELQGLQDQETKLKTDYKDKLSQAVNLEPLRKQKELVSQYVFRLEKQLPSKAEMDALLSDINQAGVGRGLQFELFKPGGVTVRDYYAELPITIRLTGSYHDLGAFAADIAALPRIVTLNNLTLTPLTNGSGLGMDATAKTFRYLDPEEITSQRKGGGKP